MIMTMSARDSAPALACHDESVMIIAMGARR
jgi:hypothetical protein